MRIKKIAQHEQWYPLPDESGKVLFRERTESDRDLLFEAMHFKASSGGDITTDIARVYLDAIADWSGVEDENGKALPCTPANKRRFLAVPGMMDFVASGMRLVAQEGEAAREAAGKNV